MKIRRMLGAPFLAVGALLLYLGLCIPYGLSRTNAMFADFTEAILDNRDFWGD